MATEELKVDPRKTYLISGKYLEALIKRIKANRPIAGQGITIAPTQNGTIINSG